MQVKSFVNRNGQGGTGIPRHHEVMQGYAGKIPARRSFSVFTKLPWRIILKRLQLWRLETNPGNSDNPGH